MGVEAARLELPGEIARLPVQSARRRAHPFGPEPLEGWSASARLLRRKRTQLPAHRIPPVRDEGEQALGLASQPSLLTGELRKPLHRLGESLPDLALPTFVPSPGQRVRRCVERAHGRISKIGRGFRSGVASSRRSRAALIDAGEGQRALERRRDERVSVRAASI